MKHRLHKYLLYGSIVFLILAIYKADYLKVPDIHSPIKLALAFVCLFGGFMLTSISQQRLLNKFNIPIRFNRALAAVGLYIFGKYIPGKVWIIAGKSLYVAEKEGYPIADVSVLFVRAQILALWCGSVMGILGLLLNDALHMFGMAGLGALVLMTVIVFSKKAHEVALGIIKSVIRKELNLPVLKFSDTIALVPWFMGPWLLWGSGFFLLCASLSDQIFPFSTLFCFPLATTLGILILFAPGGLGIREGVIVGYLTLLGIALPEAITLSAASRLWFLIGEFFVFAAGYISAKVRP